ncbi:phenylalanyl--tRNA ligase subunit alpha [Thermocladium modestius]|uniref:phenylalanine--tRNA ligase n=1 Tax=Thermocladium modestius TaxID=62609 RepID=A0A830GZR7_9CREN|nr:phenylalanine--tRNA ligase subunit alpha [Thermocladium modestius]GGP22467.1 phenylalanyl--tRNA ligase subunit alpha [Thermocladium modestius]
MDELRVTELAFNILMRASKGPARLDDVAREMGVEPSSLMRTVMELSSRGLLEVDKAVESTYELTEEGRRYLSIGSPEARLVKLLAACRCSPRPDEVAGRAREVGVELLEGEVGIAISNAARLGLIEVINGRVTLRGGSGGDPVRAALESVARGAVVDDLPQLIRRGLVRRRERSVITIKPTSMLTELLGSGAIKPARLVTALTSELIRSGEWRRVELKEFDPSVPTPILLPIGRHFYGEFIDFLKEIYESMGFQETYGPYVELELWNFDALFQAQDHPAREIHDTFFVDAPRGHGVPEDLLKKVAAVHEDGGGTGSLGWRYKWSAEKALSLVLRSQATAVSVRSLASRGDGEYRSFTIDRVFRPELLDAKHSMEFHQADGIMVGRGLTFKHLLGFHEEFARRLGMRKVMFRPSYFPFTSPSAEIYMLHGELGWIEVGGTGVFRPEVLAPLGIRESRVLAFGMGVDRLAMVVMGINDIRDLMSANVEELQRNRDRLVRALRAMA